MNININTGAAGGKGLDALKFGGFEPSKAPADRPSLQPGRLTISHAAASAEEIAAASISDSDLSRNDPLGKLVEFAFNLPPPSMPVFPEASHAE